MKMTPIPLRDVLKKCKVKSIPIWADKIILPNVPSDNQYDTLKKYLKYDRFLDGSDPGCGKTLPNYIMSALMAGMGNKVCTIVPPKTLDQYLYEFRVWLPGIDAFLTIDHLLYPKAKREEMIKKWDKKGWPDILVCSYDSYREWNSALGVKTVPTNEIMDSNGNPWTKTSKGRRYALDKTPLKKVGRGSTSKWVRPNYARGKLTKRGYNVTFVDEAHHLCNEMSSISMAVDKAAEGGALYLMTGTPVRTDLGNTYGLIHLVNPKAYKNRDDFSAQHVQYTPVRFLTRGGVIRFRNVATGFFNEEKIHRELFRYGKRVQKRSLMKMPDPILTDIRVKLTDKHMKLYRLIMTNRFAIVGRTKLAPETQQEAHHLSMKIISCPDTIDSSVSINNNLYDRFEQLLEEIDPTQHKVVVFAWYQHAMKYLQERLKQYNPAVVYGGTSSAGKQVRRFQTDKSCRVMIINWKSGGEGLNLQMASHVIFYECPSAANDVKQAIARCDRKGQTETVNVYFMRVINTLADRNYKKMLERDERTTKVTHDEEDLLYKVLKK